jgi:hypothetical protein
MIQQYMIKTASRVLAMSCLLGMGGVATAQSQGSSLADRAQRSLAAPQAGGFDFIDLSAAPGQRPRGSLKFEAEGATRALREMGVAADDCRTLVRTNSRRSSQLQGGDGSVRLGVSVSLSCSFF